MASHLVGPQMRRMVDEPDNRHEIQDGLKPVYEALSVAPLAASVKASLKLLGRDVGTPRLPLVEPNPDEVAVLRSALESQGLLERV